MQRSAHDMQSAEFTGSIFQLRGDEMYKRLTLLAATATVALCIGCATGTNENTTNTTTTTTTNANGSRTTTTTTTTTNAPLNTNTASTASLTAADREFMTKAAQGGLAEVELGRLAAQKAQSPDVKQFGQRMVDDHSRVNTELKTLATSKGVTLPTDIDAATKEEQAKLSKLTGAAFDKEYMRLMVDDHRKDVAEFEKESKDQDNADVRAFAAKTLPTLQEHLKLAETTNAKLK
jgi:putative membrane protein